MRLASNATFVSSGYATQVYMTIYGNSLTYLPFGVTENDSLCNSEGVVKVTQGIKFPFLSFHSHKKLFDPFKSQLITEKGREKNHILKLQFSPQLCIQI